MKVRRLLLRVVLLVLVLLIVAAGALWLLIDYFVKEGIERGATYAMQVPTEVNSASLHPFAGELRVDGFRAANPPGYSSDPMITVGSLGLQLDTHSLLGDTVHIQRLTIDDVNLRIEQTLGLENNVSKVMESLRRLRSPEEQPDEAGRKVRIDHVLIRNVTAQVQLPPLPGVGTPRAVAVQVPQLELRDVGTHRPDGVPIAEVVRQILPAIIASVLANTDALPPSIRNVLHEALEPGGLLTPDGGVGEGLRRLGEGLLRERLHPGEP